MLSPSEAPSTNLDATRIAPRLYQGGRPAEGHALKRAGFDVVVLCAMEHQPPKRAFPGVVVIRAPLDDAELSLEEWTTAGAASAAVARYLSMGKRVLITCQQGRNRSGLVMALTLRRMSGSSGRRIVRHIKSLRANALTNESFVAALMALR